MDDNTFARIAARRAYQSAQQSQMVDKRPRSTETRFKSRSTTLVRKPISERATKRAKFASNPTSLTNIPQLYPDFSEYHDLTHQTVEPQQPPQQPPPMRVVSQTTTTTTSYNTDPASDLRTHSSSTNSSSNAGDYYNCFPKIVDAQTAARAQTGYTPLATLYSADIGCNEEDKENLLDRFELLNMDSYATANENDQGQEEEEEDDWDTDIEIIVS